MAVEIEQRFKRLQHLVDAANAKGLDEETAAYLARYGAIYVCGNIERCIEVLVVNRFGSRDKALNGFMKAHFKRGTNYDIDQIRALLYRFSSEWGERFDRFVSDHDELKEAINSCYAIRNSVAHGGGQSLGPRTLKVYAEQSFNLIAELEGIIR